MYCSGSNVLDDLILIQPWLLSSKRTFLNQFLNPIANQRSEYVSFCIDYCPAVCILYECRFDRNGFAAKVSRSEEHTSELQSR